MRATELLRTRVALSEDAFAELVLWRVPRPVPGSRDGFKYRGAGPVSIREATRRVGRDVKAVHGEVTALLNAGVIDRTDDGRIVFPYQAVKVEFVLQGLLATRRVGSAPQG